MLLYINVFYFGLPKHLNRIKTNLTVGLGKPYFSYLCLKINDIFLNLDLGIPKFKIFI
mgnify:CR=1 FL=1